MSPPDAAPAVAPARDGHPSPPEPQRVAPDAPPEQQLKELGRAALARATEPDPVAPPPPEPVRPEDNNPTVDLARVAWVVTVLACLLAVAILVVNGYVGYAGVTLAVAVAAAINLL
jgi:hypothetical protein